VTPVPVPLLRSDGLGWRTLTAATFRDPAAAVEFVTAPSPDLLVVLVTRGEYDIESRSGRAAYRPGSVGVTAPGRSSTLRWRTDWRGPMESLHLRLTPVLFERPPELDTLSLTDPYVTASAFALGRALQAGAPALYADAVAHALAVHLTAAPPVRPESALGRRELTAVAEYVRAHLADDLDLDTLAALTHLSRYHFLRTFRRATGLTPHRYVTRVRLEMAAELLRTTGQSVVQIALAVGYRSSSQFGAAFRRAYGVSPAAYRRG
jgi:AraC family transcriptional regulator